MEALKGELCEAVRLKMRINELGERDAAATGARSRGFRSLFYDTSWRWWDEG